MKLECVCGKVYENENEQRVRNQLLGHQGQCAVYKDLKNQEKQAKGKPNAPRPKRQPLGVRKGRLAAENLPPNLVCRWINDNWYKYPTRVPDALAGGYRFLHKDEAGKIDSNTSLGSKISKVVGTNDDGSKITAYLMGIEKALYEEDQREKQKRPDAIDREILGGTIEDDPRQRRYTPREGIQIDNQLQN